MTSFDNQNGILPNTRIIRIGTTKNISRRYNDGTIFSRFLLCCLLAVCHCQSVATLVVLNQEKQLQPVQLQLFDDNDAENDQSADAVSDAFWWYLLSSSAEQKSEEGHSMKLLQRNGGVSLFDNSDSSSSSSGSTEKKDVRELLQAPKKRQPIRRCGTLLIKHIQTVCGGCLRSASDADPIIMSKRNGEARNRLKREVGFSKITDICCTQRACADEELKPFCC